jgi:hypothetical protein
VAELLTASPSNEYHTAEVHFLEASSIEKPQVKKKGSAKSETVTTSPFKNKFETKEARHVKKQQSSQTNKTVNQRKRKEEEPALGMEAPN